MTLFYKENQLKTVVIVIWLILAALGFFGVWELAQKEERHEFQQVEESMRIVTETQGSNLRDFIRSQRNVLSGVTGNVSLQLYLSTVQDLAPENTEAAAASMAFIRNYISAIAQKDGLAPSTPTTPVNANIGLQPAWGMGVFDANWQPVVASNASLTQFPLQVKHPAEGWQLIGEEGGEYRLWMWAPIMPVQSEGAPIGWAVTAQPVSQKLERMLAKVTALSRHKVPSYVVLQHDDGSLARIAANDGAVDSAETAAFFAAAEQAITQPHTLRTDDALPQPVLAYADTIEAGRLYVVRVLETDKALAKSQSRGELMLLMYLAAILALTLLVLLLWRYSMTARLRGLLEKISRHEQLLKLITDHLPLRLFIVDDSRRIRYANDRFARAYEVNAEDVTGKSLKQIMGTALAETHEECIAATLTSHKMQEEMHYDRQPNESRIYQREYIPLASLPDSEFESEGEAVLMLEDDITHIMQQADERRRILDKLIESLVMLIDQRDPYAKNHSLRVAQLAGNLAHTLSLSEAEQEAVIAASRLLNIGKLFVDPELLTKKDELSEKEKEAIAKAMQQAIEFLEPVPFNGPVIEILQQSQSAEMPKESLKAAEVLSIANRYIALTSSRSFRAAKTSQQALEILEAETGSQYSPAIMAGLKHQILNVDGV